MRAILGLTGFALMLSASVAAFAEVPLPPPRPEGIAEEAVAPGDVPLPPVRPHGIENEYPPAEGSAAAGAATQPEGEDSAACIERLAKSGVRAEPVPAIENGACGARHPLRLIGLPAGLEVSPPAIVTCAVAEALTKWVEGVSAEAERHLSGPPAKILIGTSYECRGQNRQAGAKLSEHAFANGVDVMGFAFRTRPRSRSRRARETPPRGCSRRRCARRHAPISAPCSGRARTRRTPTTSISTCARAVRAPASASSRRNAKACSGFPTRCSAAPSPRGSPCASCQRP